MASRALSERPGVHSSLIESARRKGKNARQLRNDAVQAFAKFDRDGSGCLSEREIKQVIHDLTGKVATSEQVYFLKKELDADGNNIITQEEFVLWYVLGQHLRQSGQILAHMIRGICFSRSQVVVPQVHQIRRWRARADTQPCAG